MSGRRLALPGLQLAGGLFKETRRPMASICARSSLLLGSLSAVRRSIPLKPLAVISRRQALSSTSQPSPIPSSSKWSSPALFAAGLPIVSNTEASSNPIMSTLSDLLLASPLPSYGLTIILATFFLRAALTLPVTLWQRRRAAFAIREMAPGLKAYNAKVAQELVPISRKKGFTAAQYEAEVVKKVAIYREDALKAYGLSGWRMRVQQLLPIFVNVTILVLFSTVIRNTLNIPGAGIGPESFMWLEKLADPDPFLGVIGAGFIILSGEVTSYTGRRIDEQRGKTEAAQILRREASERKELEYKEELRKRREETRDRLEAERIQASKPRRVNAGPARTRPAPPTTTASTAKRSLTTLPPSDPARSSKADKMKTAPVSEMQNADTVATSRDKDYFISLFVGGIQRLSGIALLCVGNYTPSAVVLYWASSTLFSLCQNIYLSRRQYLASIPPAAKAIAADAIPGKV